MCFENVISIFSFYIIVDKVQLFVNIINMAISKTAEREIVGICKQTLVQLCQQLRTYVDVLYTESDVRDLKPFIVKATQEVCSFVFSFFFLWWTVD